MTPLRRNPTHEEVPARGLWALWFVALALVALAVLPWYMGNRVVEAQNHINRVLQPASSLSSRLSILNSRQMARFEGFVLSGGDASFRRSYIGAIAESDEVFQRLLVLSEDLGVDIDPGAPQEPGVRERLAEVSAATTRWHLVNQRVLLSEDAAVRAPALEPSRADYAEIQRRNPASGRGHPAGGPGGHGPHGGGARSPIVDQPCSGRPRPGRDLGGGPGGEPAQGTHPRGQGATERRRARAQGDRRGAGGDG